MKEDNPITDAIKVDVTNTEDNAKGEQTTGETAALALQIVYLDEVLLTLVSVRDIDDDEQRY